LIAATPRLAWPAHREIILREGGIFGIPGAALLGYYGML
jgi:hypothetical protein